MATMPTCQFHCDNYGEHSAVWSAQFRGEFMTMTGLTYAAAAAAAMMMVVPAAATQYLVTVGGLLQQPPTNPPGTTRLDLPQISGGGFLTQFLLDGNSPGTVATAPGGVGEARSYLSALVGLQFFGPGFELTPAAGGPTQLFVLNNVGGNPMNPTARLDQVTFNAGTVFSNGVAIRPFDLSVAPDFGLPENLYVSSFTFGRSMVGNVDMLPGLIDSVDFPALDQVWSTGPFIFSLQFRQGNPTSPAEQAALPVAFLSGSSLFVDVVRIESAIPEPATWAMLIAGFGMVGSVMRRRGVRTA